MKSTGFAAIGLIIGLAISVFGQSRTPTKCEKSPIQDCIRARQLEIVDGQGHNSLVLESNKNDSPNLYMYAGPGKPRAWWHVDSGTGSVALTMFDQSGFPAINIDVNHEDVASVILRNRDGKGELYLQNHPRGTPSFYLYDSNRRQRLMGTISNDQKPILVLLDEHGNIIDR